jgi:CBS domain-containing protein
METPPSLLVGVVRRVYLGTSSILVGAPGELVSILTERDVVLAVAGGVPHTTPVGELAVPRPLTIDADAPVQAAGTAMLQEDVRHLVVTRGNRAIGVLSMRDVLRAVLGMAEMPVVVAALEEHVLDGAGLWWE